jgi:PhnB protein
MSKQTQVTRQSKKPISREVSIKLADGGKLVQGFTPHPVPHEKDGGAEVLDKFGFTWYLST